MLAFSGLGFGLPLGLDAVEGTEASLLVAAAATRAGWRRAALGALGGLAVLVPVGAGLFFAFRYLPGQDIDYAIASLIFLLGAREVREGLRERGKGEGEGEGGKKGAEAEADENDGSGAAESSSPNAQSGSQTGWTAAWPAFVGVILEGGEALLYAFGVGHGAGSYLSAGVGGAIGFSLPWVGLALLRKLIDRLPEWQVELSIGVVLMSAATVFGVLRATGVFAG